MGLQSAPDIDIWAYAHQHGYAIVTRDVDFADRFVWQGGPPSVVWLNCGNSSTASLMSLLLRHADRILALDRDEGCLTLDDRD